MGCEKPMDVIVYFTIIYQKLFTNREIDLHCIYYFIDRHYDFQNKGITERVA